MSIDGLSGIGLLTNGLYEADAAVGLQGGLAEVFPRFLDDGSIGGFVEVTVVDAPQHTVGEKGGAGGLRAWGIVLAKHGTAPVATRALHTGYAFSQFAETLHEDVPVLVVLRHIGQYFCQTGQHPTVATSPEALAVVAGCLDLRVDIFGIAVIELLLLVEHQAVAPEEVLREFVEVFHFTREFVHFRHHGHHHIEGIGPPPEMCFLHRALVAHDFDGTSYLVGGWHEVVHINIGLEADLPIAKEYEILTFAVGGVFPVTDIIALGPFPLVVATPLVGVGVPVSTAREAVSLHIAGVVGGVVPEGTDIGCVVSLPVVVDLHNHVKNGTGFSCTR